MYAAACLFAACQLQNWIQMSLRCENLLRQLDDKKQDNKAAARLSELSIAMGSRMGFTFSKTSHKSC
jgi:hypothetical protein